MKTKKKKEQFEIAETLFEMGLDFDVIKAISGISSKEYFMHKINMVDFEDNEDE